MTENQRTARIEFVKKLLVANGFVHNFKLSGINGMPFYGKGNSWVMINYNWINLRNIEVFKVHTLNHCIKPLRDFIKLSNQK